MTSVCIKRAPFCTTEQEIRVMFANYVVNRVDMVEMTDYYGIKFYTVFIHFETDENSTALYNEATVKNIVFNGLTITPNFKPITKLAIHSYSEEEIAAWRKAKSLATLSAL
jgi:hypothetical protein